MRSHDSGLVTISFCPVCRQPCASGQLCPACQVVCDAEPITYTEKLLAAILSSDPSRVGMAIEVLTEWLQDQRAIVPLSILLNSPTDVHRLVMAAKGLGNLGNPAGVPILVRLLQNPDRPFVARIAAARSLAKLGGDTARAALQKATMENRASVSKAAHQALQDMDTTK